jgi:hypothetical protein
MMKSRRMRWVGHVAHMKKIKNADKLLVRKPEGKKNHLEDLGTDGRIIRIAFRAVGCEVVDWIHQALGSG